MATTEERLTTLESQFAAFKANSEAAGQSATTAANAAKDTADAAAEALNTIKGVTTDTFAKDVEVAHLTGDEDISGNKYFNRSINCVLPMTRGTAPASRTSNGVNFMDSSHNLMGYMSMVVKEDSSSSLYIALYKNLANQDISSGIALTTTADADEINTMSVAANLICPPDKDYSLGAAGFPWAQIYAKTGSINTSDERKKTAISDYPDSLLDAWEDVDFQLFKFKDAVAKKGTDARIHAGLIAQAIKSAFEAHDIDPTEYGLFCYDSWDAQPEVKDQDGNIIQEAKEAGESYGLRYIECLCVEAACQRRKVQRLETQIAELTQKVNSLIA